ncbi:uncharacterized protein [Pleurodeles waltl]
MTGIQIIIKEEEEYLMANQDMVNKDSNNWPIDTTLSIKKEEEQCFKSHQGSEDFQSISHSTGIAYSINENKTHFADQQHLEKRRRISNHIDGNAKDAGGRKRKLKFSEKELEVLIEECVAHHNELFGKSSLQVPESEKRKIWTDIQAKISAVGVTQRTFEEIRKRWYDVRSRTKEKVASRLAEAQETGGESSTQPPPTFLEDMIEATFQQESIVGVSDIDTSAIPSTSKGDPVISSMFSLNGRHEEHTSFLAEPWRKKRHTGVNMADRKRKAKFTGRELEVLVDAIIPNESQLFGVQSHRTPISVKNKIWSRILAQVNTVAAVRRNKEDCKKKWYDLKRRIKDRITQSKEHISGICGVPGQGLEFSVIQEKVLSTMDLNNIEGTDGVDTAGETRDEQQSDADFFEDEGTDEHSAGHNLAEMDTDVFEETPLECPAAPRNDLDPLLDTEIQLLTMTQRQCDLMESLNHRISKHSAMTRRRNAALCLEVRRLSNAVGAMAAAVEKHSVKTEALHDTLLEACRSNAQAIGGIIEIIRSKNQCEREEVANYVLSSSGVALNMPPFSISQTDHSQHPQLSQAFSENRKQSSSNS